MKKIKILICLIIISSISLFGCTYQGGKRPYDYGEAIWVSDSPDAWFIVKSYDEVGNNYDNSEGQITIGDKTTEFVLDFGFGDRVSFCDNEFNTLFSGGCQFNPEKLIVTIISDKANILNGEVTKITFVRKDLITDQTSAK